MPVPGCQFPTEQFKSGHCDQTGHWKQDPETKKKDVVWFALDDGRPLAAFAGIWTVYLGDRGTKSKPIPGPHDVYGFLTTSPNAVVAPIHDKGHAQSS